MRRLTDLPLKRQLTLIILVTCTAALSLACAALAVYEMVDFRRAMVRDMTVLADVLGKNTQAALAFDDADAAGALLRALQADTHVAAARVFTRGGEPFANYSRPGTALELPARSASDGPRFANGYLALFRPITLDGKPVGTIYLLIDLQEMYDRLALFAGISALVLVGSFLLALWLSTRLQAVISRPILALAEITKAVAERNDYTIRAPRQGSNELGALSDSFNHMLARIHGQNQERKEAETKLQAQLARLNLLNQITRGIGDRLDLASIFQVVIRSLEDNLAIDFGCVGVYDPVASALTISNVGARSLTLAGELGMPPQSLIAIDRNGLSHCVAGKLVYEPDVSQIHFPFPQRLAGGGLRALVAAPLMVESKVFGVLIVARRQANSFSSAECEFLRQLGEHVALAAHQTQLYTSLQQAFDDLRHSQQAAMQQERLSALGQMASGIAHDINNAISPVALYTESLLEREPNLSPRARSYLETIAGAIDDVAATVARMREFYRQREPQMSLAPLQMNRLVQQVIDLTRARWSDMPQQRGIVITMNNQCAADLPVTMGVESEIREALTNLVFNAVDAMPEGGTLTLRTRTTQPPPNAHGAFAPEHVHVEVSDTGIGMDETTRQRCLEPFFTTKGERGTGLGLAMVYGMVQRHSAEIAIESAIGKGTTVRLSFPVSAIITEPGKVVKPRIIPTNLRILVVDDDPLLLKSLHDTLTIDGHTVVTANGGQAGIDLFRSAHGGKEPFAVVITDLGMPYVDGRKVATAIKIASPSTPVLLLTGWGQRLVAEGDIPPHVDRVLSKPPKLNDLRTALAEHCPPARS